MYLLDEEAIGRVLEVADGRSLRSEAETLVIIDEKMLSVEKTEASNSAKGGDFSPAAVCVVNNDSFGPAAALRSLGISVANDSFAASDISK